MYDTKSVAICADLFPFFRFLSVLLIQRSAGPEKKFYTLAP